MKKLMRSILAVIFLFTTPPAFAAGQAETGKPAPAFTLPDADGVSRSLSDYRGKIVVLEWTNHECPYVRKHYDSGNMQALQEEAASGDVIWLTIASSAPGMQGHTTPEQAKMIIEKEGAKAAARLLDPEGRVGNLYGAKTTPHMFVIDGQGILAYRGAIDDNPSPRPETIKLARNYVRNAIAALKEGRAPDPAQTNPYGCSVKYALF